MPGDVFYFFVTHFLGDVPNLGVTLQIGVVRYPDVGLLYMTYTYMNYDVNQHVNYFKKT